MYYVCINMKRVTKDKKDGLCTLYYIDFREDEYMFVRSRVQAKKAVLHTHKEAYGRIPINTAVYNLPINTMGCQDFLRQITTDAFVKPRLIFVYVSLSFR